MDVFEIMRLAATTFEACGVEYFVTGSLATIAYGEPRLTIDAEWLPSSVTFLTGTRVQADPNPDSAVEVARQLPMLGLSDVPDSTQV